MRLLMLTADYPPASWSGIGVAVERQAAALSELGVEVHVAVAGRRINLPVTDCRRGVYLHSLNGRRFPVDPGSFDWIHLHSLALAELAWELHSRFRTPVAYTVHSVPALELRDSPHTRFWQSVHRGVLGFCEQAVFLSHRDLAFARRTGRLGVGTVVPNGVAPSTIPPTRYCPDGPVVFAGRFAESKGLELLEQTVGLLLRRKQVDFVFAGGHGDSRGKLAVDRMLRRHPSRCRSLGWMAPARLRELMAAASIVVVPSYYEPFGLVALEAMSVGAPVLASSTGGLLEMFAGDSGGLLVASQDPAEWADELESLLDDRERRFRLHRMGPPFVRRHYDIRRTAERLISEVYCSGAGAL